jgi:hypothetical protein
MFPEMKEFLILLARMDIPFLSAVFPVCTIEYDDNLFYSESQADFAEE